MARPRGPRRRPGTAERPDARSTRDTILETALAILGRDGYAALTTRAIADEAGVNQALINYHFGTKQQLVLAIAEAMEAGKYARQGAMYAQPDVPLSQKWRQAIAFYREDLADGWTRILQELQAVGTSDPEVAARVRAILARWQALLAAVAAEARPPLDLGLPHHELASALLSFWYGMDARLTGGASEADGHFFAILERVGDWLEARERAAAATPPEGVSDG